jgi:hypothetical protein
MCIPKLVGEPAAHVSRLVYGYDNVDHVRRALASAVERGYFWSPDGVAGLYGPGGGYRPGSSFLTTYLPWIARGGYEPPNFAQVVAGAEGVFSLLMVAVTVACLLLLRELVGGRTVGSTPLGLTVSGTALAFMVLVGFAPVVTQRGFQAQSLATTAAIGGLVVLTQRRAGLGPRGALWLGTGAVIISMHSWPLAAVPLACAVAGLSLAHWREIGVRGWAGAGVLLIAAGYPAYGPTVVNRAPTHITRLVDISSTSPAVLPLPATTWGLALVAAAATTLLARRLGFDQWVRWVIDIAVIGALLTTALVAAAQWRNGHGLGGYYLQKTVYLTTLIGFVLAAAILCHIISSRHLPHRPALLTVAVLALLIMCAPLSTPWAVTHWLNHDPNALDMRAVNAALKADDGPSAEHDIVVLGSCNNTTSDYTTRWTGTMLRSWSPARDRLVAQLGVEGESVEALREYAASDERRIIDVFAKEACPLTSEIRSAALTNVRLHIGS